MVPPRLNSAMNLQERPPPGTPSASPAPRTVAAQDRKRQEP